MSLPEGLKIRERQKSDEGFIWKTWVDSYYHSRFGHALGRVIGRRGYGLIQGMLTSQLMTHESRKILVACSENDPDVLVGWICFKAPNVVDYAFVKQGFRGEGIYRALLEASGVEKNFTCTHVTDKFMPSFRFEEIQ